MCLVIQGFKEKAKMETWHYIVGFHHHQLTNILSAHVINVLLGGKQSQLNC